MSLLMNSLVTAKCVEQSAKCMKDKKLTQFTRSTRFAGLEPSKPYKLSKPGKLC